MRFYEKYELLAPLRDDGIKTFVAREITTGRALEVHLFVAGRTPENIAILAKLDRLGAAETRMIIERGELEGSPYVVAELLPGRKTLRSWVDSLPSNGGRHCLRFVPPPRLEG